MSSPTPTNDDGSHSDSSSPPPEPFSVTNPRPDLTPGIAAAALARMVALELVNVGFDSATQESLDELEGLVLAFFGQLIERSHDLAELARRTGPNFRDVVQACAQLGVAEMSELTEQAKMEPYPLDDEIDLQVISYERPKKEYVPDTLESDDESDSEPPSHSAAVLSASFLPPLPAKHSYKQTPVFPKSSIAPSVPPPPNAALQTPSPAALAHLSTLRSRLTNSQLVASSLRNLIRSTSARNPEGAGMEVDGVNGIGTGAGEEDDVVDYEGEWYAIPDDS
ncbi:Bromodomain transcription factor [Pseudohyphozyma bogoriensis]|nr:Bromodomain transcription factor [Pseudohyphozyma bogoriensis]